MKTKDMRLWNLAISHRKGLGNDNGQHWWWMDNIKAFSSIMMFLYFYMIGEC